ncbi:T-complex protein 11-like protein 1 [Sinocyclocheilus rhinocerous]|uniref:T-complex protein 11-like protein 1 n=1 Tax=Sinocyclocheilus rhinocerous TaxID=307959 RepID=UPI0007B8F5AD|nr:PREDICTED: T-complex protein 11-like protein 1 [Sinocyclocheilus rhinocerous]
MPKESDESSKEEQSKIDKDGIENTMETSEEMIRKRIRRNTPSPHRLTPQSSPPRFVSVEELMETAKGVTNMALAHEIVMNSAFQVKPYEPEEGSLEKQVKEIMHKAFWDCLESQLNEDPPSYSHAITLVGEIKETLLMDQGRFLEMQQELEKLALVASVLLIVYNSAGEAISGLPGLMERLKKTIKILLAEMHTLSFKADETFAAVAEKLCGELRGCLSQHGFSPFSSDRENTLKGQIVAAKSADNPIRKVIDSRIQTYLLGFLESSAHRCAPALPGGLTPISKELEEISVKLERLVTFNKLVYSPFYHKILQDILKQGESLDV